MASHVFFTMFRNIDRFELTRDVTHQEYAYAVKSGRTSVTGLLPPDFPFLTIQSQYMSCSRTSYHSHFKPELPWHASTNRTFQSASDAIRALYSRRD
jgi:hypothetical protein